MNYFASNFFGSRAFASYYFRGPGAASRRRGAEGRIQEAAAVARLLAERNRELELLEVLALVALALEEA